MKHIMIADFRSKIVGLAPYSSSRMIISLSPPDPPRCIKQQRQKTPTRQGDLTSTSYILDNSSLTFRKRQDRTRKLGITADVVCTNQPKPPSSYV